MCAWSFLKKKKRSKRPRSDKKLAETHIEPVNIFIMKHVFLNAADIERMSDEKLTRTVQDFISFHSSVSLGLSKGSDFIF